MFVEIIGSLADFMIENYLFHMLFNLLHVLLTSVI